MKAMDGSCIGDYYAGVHALKFTCELMMDTRDFFCKLSKQLAEFTAECNKKVDKFDHAEFGLGRELYQSLAQGMVSGISASLLKSQTEMDKPDGPIIQIKSWIKQNETTTKKVDDLADTFFRALTAQQQQENEVLVAQKSYYRCVKRLNKARHGLESLKNKSQAIPEAQWEKNVAKQERKIASRISKVETANQSYQDVLDQEFANRPSFVKAVLLEKELLEDVEEERRYMLKTAVLSFVDILNFVQIEKSDESSKRFKKLRKDVIKLDQTPLYNRSHGSYLRNYQFPEFQEYSSGVEQSTLSTKQENTDTELVVQQADVDADNDTGHFDDESEDIDTDDIPTIPDAYVPNANGEGDASSIANGKVMALFSYPAAGKGHLALKSGQIIHQVCAANAEGLAYGWVRKNKFMKKKGYYPAKCVMSVD